MSILDKIKSFFKRGKPEAKIIEEKPPEATEGKPVETVAEEPPAATVEKLAKTTQPQRKAPKVTGKKRPRASKRKGAR